ncbi:putative RNA-directed DNA polymerase from transposon BS [Trichonephila clavipes]|nr:putative RNA-directed DNA polymerase from transposon BS [Trichonephila clavipes]
MKKLMVLVSSLLPILEYGLPIYACASKSNLDKLERVQLSAGGIISGVRPSCPNDSVLFESNLLTLSLRRSYCLSKYCNKISSFGDQHRTSASFRDCTDNQRLKKYSPFSLTKTLGLSSANVEPHSFFPVGFDPKFEEINFRSELLCRVVKHSEIPNLIRQLALETVNCILRASLQIYTDGNKGDGGISARTAAEKEVSSTGYLTFSELSSLKKIELHHLERTPPCHPSYIRRTQGGSFKLMSRKYQTAFWSFVSGHINSLSFRQGQKIFPECRLCYSELVSPAHTLTFLEFKKDEVLLDPLLFLDS